MKKTFLILFVLLAVVGGYLAFDMWNKPPESIEGKKTETITAVDVVKDFEDDEAAANELYLDQALTVTGEIIEIDKNDDGEQVILLKGTDDMSGVQCTMSKNGEELKIGDQVAISGFCRGFTSVVLLEDCILN